MLGVDEMRAWYGPEHVALAADRGAIGTLLISDELFRYVVPNSAVFFPKMVIHGHQFFFAIVQRIHRSVKST